MLRSRATPPGLRRAKRLPVNTACLTRPPPLRKAHRQPRVGLTRKHIRNTRRLRRWTLFRRKFRRAKHLEPLPQRCQTCLQGMNPRVKPTAWAITAHNLLALRRRLSILPSHSLERVRQIPRWRSWKTSFFRLMTKRVVRFPASQANQVNQVSQASQASQVWPIMMFFPRAVSCPARAKAADSMVVL